MSDLARARLVLSNGGARRGWNVWCALLVAALTPVWSQAPQPVPPLQGTILFRIIVVESPDAARRVLDQLAAGENFVALAQKVSVDATGRNGGLVGPIVAVVVLRLVRTYLRLMSVDPHVTSFVDGTVAVVVVMLGAFLAMRAGSK